MVAGRAAAPLNRPLTAGAIALSLLIYALWGANNLAIKVAVQAIPPLATAVVRFSFGLGVYALYARRSGVGLAVPRGQRWPLLGLVVIFTIQIVGLHVGQAYTSAVRGTVFLATHPLFLAFFAGLVIPEDRLTRRAVGGLLIAFAGCLVTFAEGLVHSTGHLLGDTICLASAVLLGARLVVLKRLVQRLPMPRIVFWQAAIAVPLFALLSAVFERQLWAPIGAVHVAAMLYQGVVVAGFCFLANAWLIEQFRASDVAAYIFTTPLWGVLFCWAILGDPLTGWIVIGTALVAAGIAVASRPAPAVTTPPAPA